MDIPAVSKKYAEDMLQQLSDLRKDFPGNKAPFILCSDEWYILANVPFPDVDEYGDSDLLENGVGQVPHFFTRFRSEVLHFPRHLKKPFQISLVTGTLISDIFTSEIIPVLNKIQNLHVSVIPIKNEFYGSSVTVSGLLTGRDIIKQLKEKGMGDEIWVSHRLLNDEGLCTLDDMTLLEISTELQRPVKVGQDSFLQLLNGIKNA
jgi:NifB/MoaA-like Fe-S oxidoreductase